MKNTIKRTIVLEVISTLIAVASLAFPVQAVTNGQPDQGKGGTAFGDSGGPALLGGTKTVLAVTSFGTNNNCACVGYYCRVGNQDVLDWINSFFP